MSGLSKFSTPYSPMSATAGCFGLGILIAEYLPYTTIYTLALSVCILALALIPLLLRFISQSKLSLIPLTQIIWLGLLVCSLGMLCAHHATSKETAITPSITRVRGEVISVKQSTSNFLRLTLRVEATFTDTSIIPNNEHVIVQINLDELNTATPIPGDNVLVKGRLGRANSRRNPGAFDYQQYLHRQGITAQINASSVLVLGLADGPASYVRRQVYTIQQRIKQHLATHIPGHKANAVLQALILGDQSAILPDDKLNFRQTGLTHLLAVSGLHVMLVGLLLYQLLKPFCLRVGFSWIKTELIRSSVALGILVLYMLITGAKASVVRSVLMATLLISNSLLERRQVPTHSLSLAALLLLIYQPMWIFDIGFQLSFAAVGSILIFVPYLQTRVPAFLRTSLFFRGITQSVLVSVVATVGTMPVLLFHFGYVSFAGILLNIAALPLTAAALSAGMLVVIFAEVLPFVATLLGSAAGVMINLLLLIADKGALWFSFLAFNPGTLSLQSAFVFCAALAFLIYLIQTTKPWQAIKYGLLGVTLLLWFQVFFVPNSSTLEVVFFDVGHGDATLIRFPNGKNMLVDTGNRYPHRSEAGSVILPYFARERITHLDALLITHPHKDHMGGMYDLLNAMPVHRLLGPAAEIDKLAAEIPPKINSVHSLSPEVLFAGDTLHLDSNIRVRVLSPTRELSHHDNVNEASVVLQIQYHQDTFLLLGDAEKEAEQALLAHYPIFLNSDIVKLGHHGSRTSSTTAFVQQVAPLKNLPFIGLISSGPVAQFDLPDEDVVARWQKRGVEVHITANAGALQITSNGAGVKVRPF